MVNFEAVYNKYCDGIMQISGTCFCPFHDNDKTPAAKFYPDSNTLWCFSEQKLFTVYDLLEEVGKDPIEIFNKLWASYDDKQKDNIKAQVDTPITTKCLFRDSLISYDSGLIHYDDFCSAVYNSIDGLKDPLIVLYNLSRTITEKDQSKMSDYMYLGAYKQNTHIRNITSGEIINHTRNIPKNIVAFIREHNDVMLIFNMWNDKPIGVTLRGNKNKAFFDLGNAGGVFYNLCGLGEFEKGSTLYIMEGPKDVEAFKVFFKEPHCMGIMTSNTTRAQLEVLRGLTDHVVLCLDNDDTGRPATEKFVKYNTKFFDKVDTIVMPSNVKDMGDLITLYRKNKEMFKKVYKDIKEQIDLINSYNIDERR